MDSFVALFSAYWWLLFPLGFFIAAGWSKQMQFKRTQARLELLKVYAESGQEPPEALLTDIDAPHAEFDGTPPRATGATGFLVTLFTGLAGVFAVLGYTGALGNYEAEFYVVAAILGVLALAFLVSGVATGGRGPRA
ncbi:hypothetical protein [Oceanicaulis sp.]|jgi:hypothetical protein|uniref:hypothetical protein n=1 Tax=Oceanicaulis sp. TaxID=1924941 RepID=UPI000D2F7C70